MADTPLAELLDPRAIRLSEHAVDKYDAIRQCGTALFEIAAVDESYIKTMLERERSVSTYVGEGVAIPHGTLAGKDFVRRAGLSFLRFPDGVDWNGEKVTVCVGIAARDDGHVAILAELAQILLDPERARALRDVTAVDDVLRLLKPAHEEGC